MNPIGGNLRNSAVILAGNSFARAIAFVFTLLLAKRMAPEDFGSFNILKNNFSTIGMMATLGLSYAANKFIASATRDEAEKYTYHSVFMTILTCFFVSGVIFSIHEYLINVFTGKSDLQWAIFSIILMIGTALMSIFTAILNGYGLFAQSTMLAVIGSLPLFFGAISSIKWNIEIALIFISVPLLATAVLAASYLLKSGQLRFLPFNASLSRRMIFFSAPLFIQEVVFSVSIVLVNKILLSFGGLSQVGIYGAAYQLFAIVMFLPLSLNGLILTNFSRNEENTRFILKISFGLLILSAFSIITFFFLSDFIEKFYDNRYPGISRVVMTLIASVFFSAMGNVFIQWLISKGLTILSLRLAFAKDFLFLVLSFVLCSYVGSEITARASSIAFLISNACYFLFGLFIFLNMRRRYVS